jgi:hypothetical protein
VIDSVDVVSVAGYPAIRVQSIRVGRYVGYNCTDLGPVPSLTGCVQPALAPASKYAIPAAPLTAAHGPGLVIELAGPAKAQCAVLTKIVLHYHVGIRHYAASYPQGTVSICAPHARQPPDGVSAVHRGSRIISVLGIMKGDKFTPLRQALELQGVLGLYEFAF